MIQEQFPLWLLILLLGFFLAAIVFCTTTNDHPPKYHAVSLSVCNISSCILLVFGFEHVYRRLWFLCTEGNNKKKFSQKLQG